MTEREFNIKLGSALRKERKKHKLSIFDIADRLGLGKSTIAYWESGERTISAKQWKMYCDALGISLDDFVEKYDL